MTKRVIILLVSIMMVGALAIKAGNGFGNGTGAGNCIFIDENGDGINDNFRDHDGDGIPNYQDPDWVRPQDGTGSGNGHGRMNRRGTRTMTTEKTRNSFSSSFQTFHNYGGNFGSGVCDESGSTTGGRGRRGGR